ncbi:hypothetical protein SSE37_17423 [Sagittula stellata E-37]|uniref:Uncharacterized protein n=1 Tax=Sagittula stellata (strain ATCC 700073 / DSM 11524 / E-37) TaxID=388399 RepID=A3K356_SAGS3|nr:hypothetical protein SSE37_17423 [Sagittula stellata E-37]
MRWNPFGRTWIRNRQTNFDVERRTIFCLSPDLMRYSVQRNATVSASTLIRRCFEIAKRGVYRLR